MTWRCESPTAGAAEELAAKLCAFVPVLQTERLTLRAPKLEDFPACAEIACTERGRFVGGPMDREDAWDEFAKMAAGWVLHGHGAFTVTDKATSEVYGFVVLGLEPGDQEIELGYALTETGEGRGIASEAAKAVREWAEAALGLTGLVSYIDAKNDRSIALAEGLGAKRDPNAEALLGDAGTLVFRHVAGGGS